ncbi:Mur ligase, partial [Lophiotrema nucula]
MIQPGLERIGLLLKNVKFPWKSIHVAGTNGKGSICAYASALLTRQSIKNGRFTSPHMVDSRWDCIQINDQPVQYDEFRDVEKRFLALNEREKIGASEFEVLTATAFQLFNDQKVQVGVVEVGMGGRLDATNILNNQAVSVISKIAHDHQSFLGNTLEEIADHKAGILRPNVPYIVNPVNEWVVHEVIEGVARTVNAGPRLRGDTPELEEEVYGTEEWSKFSRTLAPFQRDNAVSAYLAFREACEAIGKTVDSSSAINGLEHKTLGGRQQTKKVKAVFGKYAKALIVDGAHNEDAASALADFLSCQPLSTKFDQQEHKRVRAKATWVLAMTQGKDPRKFLSKLLQPGDTVVTTIFNPVQGMPWVKPMDPFELLRVAKEVQTNIRGMANRAPFVHRALTTAKHLMNKDDIIIVTGSLYLVGDFLREERDYKKNNRIFDMASIDKVERRRVNGFLSDQKHELKQAERASRELKPLTNETHVKRTEKEEEENARIKLEEEIAQLDEELKQLTKREK